MLSAKRCLENPNPQIPNPQSSIPLLAYCYNVVTEGNHAILVLSYLIYCQFLDGHAHSHFTHGVCSLAAEEPAIDRRTDDNDFATGSF